MINVYFTVDTESSMASSWERRERLPLRAERHIFCRIGGHDYGIGLITRILASHGFRATHFVETLATLVNGCNDSRSVFDYLLTHNQDVQLHAHPCYRFYADAMRAWADGGTYSPPPAADIIGSFEEGLQFELLQQAADLFRQFAGRVPQAFRAGCFAANAATLRCLRRLGILLDSSFNPCYPDLSFPGSAMEANRISQLEGVWEVPITIAQSPLPESFQNFKHADVSSLSVPELRQMLEFAVQQGQRHFVLLFHSFSAVKPKDETYGRMRPDRIVIRRFEKFVRYLADHPQTYTVRTFGELAQDAVALQEEAGAVARIGMTPAVIRKSVQALNRFYWL